jgi:hypothetical protein
LLTKDGIPRSLTYPPQIGLLCKLKLKRCAPM